MYRLGEACLSEDLLSSSRKIRCLPVCLSVEMLIGPMTAAWDYHLQYCSLCDLVNVPM